MNDEHTLVVDGVQWERVFIAPQATTDTRIDAFSQKDFVNKTGRKSGTLGNLLDMSREFSDKRAQKVGDTDPLKQKVYDDWSKARGGKIHRDDPRRQKK